MSKILSSTAKATSSIADVSVKTGDLVERLNKAVDRLDNVLAGAETAIGSGEIKGSIVEIGDAARSIRELANHLDSRTADLSDRFGVAATDGLRQLSGIVVDSRRTLAEIERAVREFRQNPQQLITGAKPPVPSYAGH